MGNYSVSSSPVPPLLMMNKLFVLLGLVGAASSLRVAGTQLAVRSASASKPQMNVQRLVANSAVAASLAFALSTANPAITAAEMPLPSMPLVEQYGSALVADEDLRPEQQKFLEERAKMKTQYEEQVESTFTSAEDTESKKSVYTTVVSGLVIISFVAPMITYFYYTGGQ